jgi:tRNA threonylcarbamoyladenosine biosynthesis protein TsaB
LSKFLLVESSGDVCSAAVSADNIIVSEKTVVEQNAHSTYLAQFIDDVLKEAGLKITELDAVVVGSGPGSYTGLRIGTSLAKGICFGADISLIACSTLKGIAVASFEANDTIETAVSLIDARRMDAYLGVFTRKLENVIEEKFITLDEQFAVDYNNEGVGANGSGVKKWLDDFVVNKVADCSKSAFSAVHLLPEATQRYNEKQFEDVAYFEPNYIKSVFVTKPKPKF